MQLILSENSRVWRIDRGTGDYDEVTVAEAVKAAVRSGQDEQYVRDTLRHGLSVGTTGFVYVVPTPE